MARIQGIGRGIGERRMWRSILQCLSLTIVLLTVPSQAQQFNSDSWLSKDPGVATVILTGGQRNSMLMTTFSLLPKWEFTAAAFIYNGDRDKATNDGYSTMLYAKYMFYENKPKTGGAAVKFGTGLRPGVIADVNAQTAFRTYWMNAPLTVPLFGDKLSVDIMPGLSVTRNLVVTKPDLAWNFTYSGRVAWYPWSQKWSLVGEAFGSAGQESSIPEIKAGFRWEPNRYQVWAFTYGKETHGDGTGDSKFEVGLMLFTPPFFCIWGCR